ncbi:MAG: hypothetical protein HYS77_07055, partial [Candidatus Rokubacteria bacterium]|nr:hypothetical protein [Candidatus Rokubacteria bacterium]
MRRARLAPLALGLALALGVPAAAQRPGAGLAPRFEVDPSWPRPLPNGWRLGQAAGVAVDARDHVWVVHRPRTVDGPPAPPVLELDAEGRLLQGWGGPGAGYDWPASEHGIFVDSQGHVWVAGNGSNEPRDRPRRADGRLALRAAREGRAPLRLRP